MTEEPNQPFSEQLKKVAAALGISCASELPEPPERRTSKKIWAGSLTRDHQDMAGKLYDGLKGLAEGCTDHNYKKWPKNPAALQVLGSKEGFLKLAAEQFAAQVACGGEKKAREKEKPSGLSAPKSDAHAKTQKAQELVRDGKPDEGFKLMEEALDLARKANDDGEEVEILCGMALMSSERRHRGDRRRYLEAAEKKVAALKSSAAKVIFFRAKASAREAARD